MYGPQQPDLNLFDYAVYEGLCSTVCISLRFPARTISKTETCWENLNQKNIDKSIDHWRDKLKAVIRLTGGHTEQLF